MNKTKIFNWQKSINTTELKEVINCLNNGGVIIYPTDTVYGIGCNAFNEEAIQKLFSFKKRPDSKPINVLASDNNQISLVAKSINNIEKELISKYMPGALTIILPKKENISNTLTANLDTIGVRIPNNSLALTILKNLSYPLATTSVNISGQSPGIELADFLTEFQDKVDIIIDGGKSELQVASTIVKVDNDKIEILRQGSLFIK